MMYNKAEDKLVMTGQSSWTTKLNGIKNINKNNRSKTLNLGTWNVQGTNSAGAYRCLEEALETYRIDVAALQETKQKGNNSWESENWIIFNSGYNTKYFGTGFMVKKELTEAVIDFEAISERICRIRLRGMYRKITILNVHAPTNEKEETEKDMFYEEVAQILNKVPKYDIKIILGDLNAKIGREERFVQITGGNSKHEITNENGNKLIEFAFEHDLKIMSTTFMRKDIYKGTWVSPCGKFCNQIDHVLIERKHTRTIQDVKSRRGAGADSDHFLVKIKIRESIPKQKADHSRKVEKYNTELLKDENISKTFENKLDEALESLENIEHIQQKWKKTEEIIKTTTSQILKKTKGNRKVKWFDDECKEAMKKKINAKVKLIQTSNEQDKKDYDAEKKNFKKLCRKKKRKNIEKRLEQVEENYRNKNIRNFYQEVKKQKAGFQQKPIFCRDLNGQLVTGEARIKRWKEYFDDLLNKDTESEEEEDMFSDIITEDTDLYVEPPDNGEIRKIIGELKNNKSAGENGMVAELFKYGGQQVRTIITETVQDVWKNMHMPENWNESLLCPIYKKGEKEKCENYRGIAIVDTAYKILAICIRNRLKEISEKIIGDYQSGFRSYRSTTDQIFTLKQMIANSHEYNLPLQILFIDFKQAYDSIKRQKLYEIMRNLKVPEKLIRLVEMTQKSMKCKVMVGGSISESFNVRRGLRQGDPMSPILFNLVLEWVLRESKIRTTGVIHRQKHQCLAYADDIALVTRSNKELEDIFKRLEKMARKVGLHINEDKTKFMQLNLEKRNGFILRTETKAYNFEEVTCFNYLGVILTNNNSEELEIASRIAKGSRCVGSVCSTLSSKQISRAAKVQLYKSIIRPTVMYGCELWALGKTDEAKLAVWERKVLRKIFGAKKIGEIRVRRTNAEIMKLYGETSIVGLVKAQRLRWLGHVWRMPEDRTVREFIEGGVRARRRRGRPKVKWFEAVKKDLKMLKIDCWETQAKDRDRWRRIVEEAKGLQGLES